MTDDLGCDGRNPVFIPDRRCLPPNFALWHIVKDKYFPHFCLSSFLIFYLFPFQIPLFPCLNKGCVKLFKSIRRIKFKTLKLSRAIFICTQVFRTGKNFLAAICMAHPITQEAFGSTDEAHRHQKGQSYQVWRNNYQRDLYLCLDFHLRTKIYNNFFKTNYFDFPAQNSHSLLLSSSNGHWIWINYHSCMPVQSFSREKKFYQLSP